MTRVFLDIPPKDDCAKARAELMGRLVDELNDDIFVIVKSVQDADVYCKWVTPDQMLYVPNLLVKGVRVEIHAL